eukprot:TRINITY_DN6684_c0_g1_i1.p1 TRINITY_DN6684_c0_g1~~TRINITY_DN6684_c0_g1_i1.p1  ORF type:complete len:421 (+),score=51.79 TRINITY_DN6684_c0_g1_i1:444-1706(+)
MQSLGLTPSVATYTNMVHACSVSRDLPAALQLVRTMKTRGANPSLHTYNALVNACMRSGDVDRAFTVLDDMMGANIQPNEVVYTSLIHGCVENKMFDRAWSTFYAMREAGIEPDSVTFTTMIDLCSKTDMVERAINFYEEMLLLHVPLTEVTYNSLIHACARRADSHHYPLAFKLLQRMKADGYSPELVTMTTILNAAARSGDVKSAEIIFEELQSMIHEADPSDGGLLHALEIASNTMLNAYAQASFKDPTHATHYITRAEALFESIKTEKVPITQTTMNNMLRVYTRAGRLNRATSFFESFSTHGIVPDVISYTQLIGMLCRHRRMERAFEFASKMKDEGIELNYHLNQALLYGCALSGYIKTGMSLLRDMASAGMRPHIDDVVPFRQKCARYPDLVKEINTLCVHHRDMKQIFSPTW